MYIRTSYTGCNYLTAGKLYEVIENNNDSLVTILDDDGDCIVIHIQESSHINDNAWEVVGEELPNSSPNVESQKNSYSKILVDYKLTTLSPELLAEAFWNLDSEEQARFYNHLDTVADFHFPFQLQSITDEQGLTLAGRRVMGCIGEYSHWGLVPKINSKGEVE